MSEGCYNIITFTPDSPPNSAPPATTEPVRVALRMATPIKLEYGLKPNMWTAVVSYKEFAKLGNAVTLDGKIELWFTAPPEEPAATPDVTIEKVRLHDAEPSDYGVTDEDVAQSVAAGNGSGTSVPGRAIEYTLTLSDFRWRYTGQRGGRLEEGRINPSRKKKDDPANDRVAEPVDLQKLVKLCLEKMGQTSDAPETLSVFNAPKDLRWFGNHAPTELSKLLDQTDHVVAPTLDGQLMIWGRGEGNTDVQIPDGRALPEVKIKGADRRGKFLVVTSYPQQVVFTDDFGNYGGVLEFVYPDPNLENVYVPIDDCSIFNGDAASQVRTSFRNVPESHRAGASNDAYHFVRFDPGAFSPVVQPLLPEVYEWDAQTKEIKLQPCVAKAQVAARLPTGEIRLSSQPVDLLLNSIDRENNVMRFGLRLGKFQNGATAGDADAKFEPINLAYMSGKFSLPYADWSDEKERWIPKYFKVGFKRNDQNAIVKLSDDELKDAEKDPDCVFVTDPQLIAILIGGQTVYANKEKLEKDAQAYAESNLRLSTTQPRIRKAVGFLPVEIDGVTSSVAFDQSAVTTTFTSDDWFRPGGAAVSDEDREEVKAAEAFPNQKATADDRASRNDTGAGPAIIPVRATPGGGDALPSAAALFMVLTVVQAQGFPIPTLTWKADYVRAH